MHSTTLLSLDCALLDRIIQQLVKRKGVREAVAHTCLINKRFVLLVRQPLAAWDRLYLGTLSGRKQLSSQAIVSLALWARSVAPAIKHLGVAPLFKEGTQGHANQLALDYILPYTKKLQVGGSSILILVPSLSAGRH